MLRPTSASNGHLPYLRSLNEDQHVESKKTEFPFMAVQGKEARCWLCGQVKEPHARETAFPCLQGKKLQPLAKDALVVSWSPNIFCPQTYRVLLARRLRSSTTRLG